MIFNTIIGGGTDGKILQYASAKEVWDTTIYKNVLTITTKDDAPPIKKLYTIAVGNAYVGGTRNYNVCLNWPDGAGFDGPPLYVYISGASADNSSAFIEQVDEHTIKITSSADMLYKFDFCLIVYTS